MAHLLSNDPGQQDAGEILLSGFTHMALQMEAQRRLIMQKPTSKPRRGKKGPKKQPQRGLGVAQLEKIRLEEQRRASQHVQQLAALRQLQSAVPSPFSSSNAGMQAPTASIIPQMEREINHSNMLHMHPSMSSSLTHFPSMNSISSSFLLNNVSGPPLGSTARSTIPPSTPTTSPLELFPAGKLTTTSSIKASKDILHPPLQHVVCNNRGFLHNPYTSLDLSLDQSYEGHDHGGLSYSLLHMRRNCVPLAELRYSSPTNQVPNRIATPSSNLDKMVELSSFQSSAASLAGKRPAWGTLQQPDGEPHTWAIPSLAHYKAPNDHGLHGRRSEEECELTLRPPGTNGNSSLNRDERRQANQVSRGPGPHNFLSLSMGTTLEDSVGDASSSTPSRASATATTTTTSTTDEYTSSSTCMQHHNNLLSTKNYLHTDVQKGKVLTCDVDLDLTLKL